MFFCTGVGRKNVVLVEKLSVQGSWNTRDQMIMTIDVFLVVINEKALEDS